MQTLEEIIKHIKEKKLNSGKLMVDEVTRLMDSLSIHEGYSEKPDLYREIFSEYQDCINEYILPLCDCLFSKNEKEKIVFFKQYLQSETVTQEIKLGKLMEFCKTLQSEVNYCLILEEAFKIKLPLKLEHIAIRQKKADEPYFEYLRSLLTYAEQPFKEDLIMHWIEHEKVELTWEQLCTITVKIGDKSTLSLSKKLVDHYRLYFANDQEKFHNMLYLLSQNLSEYNSVNQIRAYNLFNHAYPENKQEHIILYCKRTFPHLVCDQLTLMRHYLADHKNLAVFRQFSSELIYNTDLFCFMTRIFDSKIFPMKEIFPLIESRIPKEMSEVMKTWIAGKDAEFGNDEYDKMRTGQFPDLMELFNHCMIERYSNDYDKKLHYLILFNKNDPKELYIATRTYLGAKQESYILQLCIQAYPNDEMKQIELFELFLSDYLEPEVKKTTAINFIQNLKEKTSVYRVLIMANKHGVELRMSITAKLLENRVPDSMAPLIAKFIHQEEVLLSDNEYRTVIEGIDPELLFLFNSMLIFQYNTEDDTAKKLRTFILVHKNSTMNVHYDYEKIYSKFSGIFKSEKAKYITELTQGLYPNSEYTQIEMFKLFSLEKSSHSKEGVKTLLAFAQSLKEDEPCMDLLNFAVCTAFPIKPYDILTLAGNRVSSYFVSLKESLNEITLGEAILEENWKDLQKLFDNKLDTKMPLTGFFAYYDLHKKTNVFINFLKPGIHQRIKDAYRAPQDKVVVLPPEHFKLVNLEIDQLPKLYSLCAYMKQYYFKQDTHNQSSGSNSVTKQVPPLEDSIKAIQTYLDTNPCEESQLINSSGLTEYQAKTLFLEFVKKGASVNLAETSNFFEKLTVTRINTSDRKKLLDLYESRLKELAYLFAQPAGIGHYIAVLQGIGEGCVANIGTKTNIIIMNELYKGDPLAQVLIPFFVEHIFNEIAKHSDILGYESEGTNMFTNHEILTAYLSPAGLISCLAKKLTELPDTSLIAHFTKTFATEEEWGNYVCNIMDFKDANEREVLKPRLASYLIVRQMIKDEIKNTHFDQIRAELEPLLADDFDIEVYRNGPASTGPKLK